MIDPIPKYIRRLWRSILGKLRILSGKQVFEILSVRGCAQGRVRGSLCRDAESDTPTNGPGSRAKPEGIEKKGRSADHTAVET